MVLSDPLPKYQYRALAHPSHIRILVLFPASNYELSLEAWLIHVDREDILRGRTEPSCYEAISYCWGDAIFSHSLTCDDRTTLPITRNVDIMLRHLRKRHEPRYLWVDAICLNQEDAAEKDTQVRLMGEIYQEATKVCIWLGESKETDGVPQVLRALKTVAIRIRHKDRSGMAAQQREELISVCGSEYRPMFRDFFSRPWFGRRWVLQEAVFGRDVMVRCGHHKLNWSWLVAGVDCLYYPGRSEEGPISDDAFTSAARTVMTIHNGTKMGLLGLLWEHNRSECFLPQDKIFALYNIANDAQQVLNVDYTRHWTKVYTQVARVYIERSGCVILKHLLCFGSLAQISPSYPSWVPNWSASRTSNRLVEALASQFDTGIFGTPATDNAEEKALRVRVHRVCTVERVMPSLNEAVAAAAVGVNVSFTLDTLAKALLAAQINDPDALSPLDSALGFSSSCEPMALSFHDLIVQTLFQATKDALHQTALANHSIAARLMLRSTATLNRNAAIAKALPQALERVFLHHSAFTAHTHNLQSGSRRLLGIGPLALRPGDHIVHHADMYRTWDGDPDTVTGFVLRRAAGARRKRYTFVGLCFVSRASLRYGGCEVVEIV